MHMAMQMTAIFWQRTYTWLTQAKIQITHLDEKLLLIYLRTNISSIMFLSNNIDNSGTTKLQKTPICSPSPCGQGHNGRPLSWATALCLAGTKIPMTCCTWSTGTTRMFTGCGLLYVTVKWDTTQPNINTSFPWLWQYMNYTNIYKVSFPD